MICEPASAPVVGSIWRNHVTREIWVVVSVDVTPGYVELRREGRRDIATPISGFHLDWSELE